MKYICGFTVFTLVWAYGQIDFTGVDVYTLSNTKFLTRFKFGTIFWYTMGSPRLSTPPFIKWPPVSTWPRAVLIGEDIYKPLGLVLTGPDLPGDGEFFCGLAKSNIDAIVSLRGRSFLTLRHSCCWLLSAKWWLKRSPHHKSLPLTCLTSLGYFL